MNNVPTINLNSNVIATQKTTATSNPSLRAAINAMCHSCLYDKKSGLGTWRQQVEACTAKTCPLYNVRPRSTRYRAQGLNTPENSELGQNGLFFDVVEANHAHE